MMRGILAAGLALLATPALAAKTDVVVLRNGDRVTGEVELLERGRLQLSTDDMGTLQIEWDKVASVAAGARFDVDDLAGRRYVGSLQPGPSAGELRIVSAAAATVVPLASVARLRRIGRTFWRRLDGSVDAGASYASASELFALDLAAGVRFEEAGFELALDGTSNVTVQPDAAETRRNALSLAYQRRISGRWLGLAQGQLEQNEELGFDLRSSATAGAGRFFVRRQRDRLIGGLGLSLNREQPLEGENNTNVELVALISYDRFSYDHPKIDVSVTAAGFASLSDSGRWRLELDARLKRELVKDFYATVRGYESYDSRPATADAEQNDYGVTFALGWSF